MIVKVRRPGIEEQIELDLALLRSTAELFERHSERAQLLQSRALADELEAHLRADKNLTPETAKALSELFRVTYKQFSKPGE